MDKRIRIWDLLHDGEITVAKQHRDTLIMFVSIPYVRSRFNPLGDSFVLTLSGLRRAVFSDLSGNSSSLQEALEGYTPEILSTDSKSMPLLVATNLGELTLDFEDIDFALDTGQRVAYEAIEKACKEYWAELRANTQQPD